MSKLQKPELLEHIEKAIEESGGGYRLIRSSHPFIIYAFNREDSERFRIYIWNITHGGYPRAANEFRIQITLPRGELIEVKRPLKTLLLGYDSRFKVFAGFNAARYEGQGQGSESLQIKEEFLAQAASDGFAVQAKEKDEDGNITEVAVAFSPEQFLTYAFSLDAYHRQSIPPKEFEVIQKAASSSLSDEDLTILPEERRRAIKTFNAAVRNGRFSKNVLIAYGHKCAICGMQLKLVEAAHIVPVKDKGTDEVVNGIALCANHHKAFDDGLIILRTDGHIMVIEKKTRELRRRDLHGGLREFIADLNAAQPISVPVDPRYRPKKEYVEERLRLEGFRGTL